MYGRLHDMNRLLATSAFALVAASISLTPRTGRSADDLKPMTALPSERPLVAIWRQHGGFTGESGVSYLRVAIWEDGRVLVGRNSEEWGHELLEGRVAANRIAHLKAALVETGVFDLKKTAFVVPDLPCDHVLVDLGNRRQFLAWLEEPTPGRDSSHPVDDLENCWQAINGLALVACPDQLVPAKIRFEHTPESWILWKR